MHLQTPFLLGQMELFGRLPSGGYFGSTPWRTILGRGPVRHPGQFGATPTVQSRPELSLPARLTRLPPRARRLTEKKWAWRHKNPTFGGVFGAVSAKRAMVRGLMWRRTRSTCGFPNAELCCIHHTHVYPSKSRIFVPQGRFLLRGPLGRGGGRPRPQARARPGAEGGVTPSRPGAPRRTLPAFQELAGGGIVAQTASEVSPMCTSRRQAGCVTVTTVTFPQVLRTHTPFGRRVGIAGVLQLGVRSGPGDRGSAAMPA